MMFCEMFSKYITKSECVFCDSRAGLQKDSWAECTSRREHHPLRDSLRWWLKPEAFIFKTLIAMRWIVRRLSPRSRITIWSDNEGWHFGQIEISHWMADS